MFVNFKQTDKIIAEMEEKVKSYPEDLTLLRLLAKAYIKCSIIKHEMAIRFVEYPELRKMR